MNRRGIYAVITMIGLAVAMSAFAWWWNLQRGAQCVQFWGPQAARQIRLAEQVHVYQLTDAAVEKDPTDDKQSQLDCGSFQLRIEKEQEITGLRGLVHARNSLLEDTSFQWREQLPAEPRWQYALRWTEGETHVTALFALEDHCLEFAEGEKRVVLSDFALQAWRKVLPRYLTEQVQVRPSARTQP